MSARIRPARPADIEPVCALLNEKMNRKIAPERWARLMTYDWLAEKPDLGRVVEADGQVLGYVGMVYADRAVPGADGPRSERTVNICAWYLDKSLRGQGLGTAMMAEATDDPALTYDIMTSSKNTLQILDDVGYTVLDDHRFVWRKSTAEQGAIKITEDPATIRRHIEAAEHKLLDDMAGLPAKPLLLEAGGAQSLLFVSIKRKAGDVLWYDILHASDGTHLSANAQGLADALLPDGTAQLAADCRFAPHPPPGAERQRLPVPRFVKTTRMAHHEVDHLYTELQLLDLKLD